MMPSLPTNDHDGGAPLLPMSPASPSGHDRWAPVLRRLSGSAFRARFRLSAQDLGYWRVQGIGKIAAHAQDFIARRLAPAHPVNDGKQTPMRGHPVFVAQHATATCCRGCLAKWHGMQAGVTLTEAQQHDVVEVIMAWLTVHTAAREGEVIRHSTSRTKKSSQGERVGERPEGSVNERSKTKTRAATESVKQQENETNQNRQGRLF